MFQKFLTGRHSRNADDCKKNNRGPHVALMFLTYGGLNQPEIWHQFLKEPNGHQFHPFIHNKEPFQCDFGFDRFCVPVTVPTAWGHNSLVDATLLLLQQALRCSEIEFFVLLSNSCVPLRSPSEIQTHFQTEGISQISVNASSFDLQYDFQEPNFWKRGQNCVYQSQWMVLDRPTASFFAQKSFTSMFHPQFFALDERYFGNLCLQYGIPFLNEVVTFVQWDNTERNGHPQTFWQLGRKEVGRIKQQNKKAMFMRKIHPNTLFLFSENLWDI